MPTLPAHQQLHNSSSLKPALYLTNEWHCGASLSKCTWGRQSSFMHMTITRMWLSIAQPMATDKYTHMQNTRTLSQAGKHITNSLYARCTHHVLCRMCRWYEQMKAPLPSFLTYASPHCHGCCRSWPMWQMTSTQKLSNVAIHGEILVAYGSPYLSSHSMHVSRSKSGLCPCCHHRESRLSIRWVVCVSFLN